MKHMLRNAACHFGKCIAASAGVCFLHVGVNLALHDAFDYPAAYEKTRLNTGIAHVTRQPLGSDNIQTPSCLNATTRFMDKLFAPRPKPGQKSPPLLVTEIIDGHQAGTPICVQEYSEDAGLATVTINAGNLAKLAAYGDSLQVANHMDQKAQLYLYEDIARIRGFRLEDQNAYTDHKDIYFGVSLLKHLTLDEAKALYGHELAHARLQTTESNAGKSPVALEWEADRLGLQLTGKTRAYEGVMLKLAKLHDYQPMDYFWDHAMEMTGQATHPSSIDRARAVKSDRWPAL